MCALDAMVLHDDEGTGEEARYTGGCGYNDTVDDVVPGDCPARVGSGLGESPCSLYDLGRTPDDQELRLGLNGSDAIGLAVIVLRWVKLSGNARLLPPTKLPSRVVGTRNVSRTSRRVGSHISEFCSIASFSWRRTTRSKVKSNSWEMITQLIIDR